MFFLPFFRVYMFFLPFSREGSLSSFSFLGYCLIEAGVDFLLSQYYYKKRATGTERRLQL
jgi:hypothetical protein